MAGGTEGGADEGKSFDRERCFDVRLASRATSAALLGIGHPFSYPGPGLPSTLENITLDDVKNFYAAHIPVHMSGVIVSTSLPQEEIDRITAHFAPPAYETLGDTSSDFEAKKADDQRFRIWTETNLADHKMPGYTIVNLSLKAPGQVPGDMLADTMDAVADLADQFSMGELRVNHRQNLVFVDVLQKDLHALWQAFNALELATPNIGLASDIIACPGLDYCALANARSIPIAQDIGLHFAKSDKLQEVGNLTINISGCMNACGHHHEFDVARRLW